MPEWRIERLAVSHERRFYLKYDFKALEDDERHLYLTMKKVRQLFDRRVNAVASFSHPAASSTFSTYEIVTSCRRVRCAIGGWACREIMVE